MRTGTLFRRLVVPIYIPIGLSTVGVAMLVPVLPLYLDDSGVALRAAAIVLGASGIGSAVGSVPIGATLARWGERATMVAAFVALAVSFAPLGYTDMAVLLVGLQVLTGLGTAAVRLAAQTFVARRVDSVRRGRALALIGGSFRIALLVGPALGGVLADGIGYRSTFLVAAGLSALGLIPSLRSDRSGLEPLAEPAESSGSRESGEMGLAAMLRRHWRRLAVAGIIPLLVTAVRVGRFIVLPLIADEMGMSATEAGVLVTISSAADLVLFPLAGWVMDRFGRLYAMVPSFALIGLGLVVLGVAESPGAVLVAAVIMGIGNGLGSGSMLTLGADLAPADATGPFLAGMAAAQGLGRLLGALMVGFVGSWAGLGASAIALAITMVAVIGWMFAVIGETRT